MDPPYFISLADDESIEGVETFVYGTEPTEYPARNLVPLDVGLCVVEEFFHNPHVLPKSIKWERL